MNVLVEMRELIELYCLAGRRRDAKTGKCLPRAKHATARSGFHALRGQRKRFQRIHQDPTR